MVRLAGVLATAVLLEVSATVMLAGAAGHSRVTVPTTLFGPTTGFG